MLKHVTAAHLGSLLTETRPAATQSSRRAASNCSLLRPRRPQIGCLAHSNFCRKHVIASVEAGAIAASQVAQYEQADEVVFEFKQSQSHELAIAAQAGMSQFTSNVSGATIKQSTACDRHQGQYAGLKWLS